jgi:hypothetical protein
MAWCELKLAALAVVVCLTAALAPSGALARGEDEEAPHSRVPVVMEKATVRGRVIILETRRSDRAAIQDLGVEVWSTYSNGEKREQIHATRTGAEGLFSLPALEEGEYLMAVGELRLKLLVVPPAAEREGQDEPKILLILVPKESIPRGGRAVSS